MSNGAKRFKSDEDSQTELPDLYSIFKGEVASIQQYGIFVKIPGLKKHGLVHVSQISTSRVDNVGDVCEAGEKVYCKVISLEGDKIALSMKVVNQGTGQDLDPNNVQTSQDQQRKRQGYKREVPRIELGAVYDTTCKKCGGKGHLAQDCFHRPGDVTYELIEEKFEWPTARQTGLTTGDQETKETKSKDKHKHKKEKKHKKEMKEKKEKRHKEHKEEKLRSSSKKASTSTSSSHGEHHRHHSSSSPSEHRNHLDNRHDSNSDSSNKRKESRRHNVDIASKRTDD